MEYYLPIKKNEILLFAGKWMELENIMLGEVSLVQKDKGCMFTHMYKIHPNTNISIIICICIYA
jgi:hypothetical protein